MRPIIKKRKEEIAKRYGKTPLVVSSGTKVTWEKDYPKNMKLNLHPEVIEELK